MAEHSRLARSVLRYVALLAAVFAALLHAAPAVAHDLAFDQLRLFRDARRGTLHAQLLFDPELTRDPAAQLAPDEAKRRVLAFVRAELRIDVDGTPCEPSLEVRELWSVGGAVPGDSVMLECAAQPVRDLRVEVGRKFEALVVTVQSGPDPNGHPTRSSVLVKGGERTPLFSFEGARDAAWRAGGPEQFATAPGASAAPPSANAPGGASSRAGSPGFANESVPAAISRFVSLGYVHILPEGLDHVLFVAGLVLGAGRRYRRLLLEISAFTLAHTLTLALGALGWVKIPPEVIEPLIAASIVLVAVENLVPREERKHRVLLVFVFGLVHGQGFAGVLRETGLPEQTFLAALLAFNVGVELGQLTVVLVLAFGLHFLSDVTRMRYAVRPGSLAIGLVGAFWAVTRIAAT